MRTNSKNNSKSLLWKILEGFTLLVYGLFDLIVFLCFGLFFLYILLIAFTDNDFKNNPITKEHLSKMTPIPCDAMYRSSPYAQGHAECYTLGPEYSVVGDGQCYIFLKYRSNSQIATVRKNEKDEITVEPHYWFYNFNTCTDINVPYTFARGR